MNNPTDQNTGRLAEIITARKFLFAMLIVAAVLPTALLWNKATYATGDSYMYMRAGMNLVRGHGFVGMDGGFMYVQDRPLYPIVIGLASLLTSHVETAARLISLFGATLAVVAFYWLVKQRQSQTIAIVAALVFALLPLRVWSGQWIQTNGLALGLLLSGITLLFMKERPSRAITFSTGGLIGLAYLTRSEMIVPCAAAFGYLLLFSAFPNFKKRLFASALFLLAFLMFVLPHQLWLSNQMGPHARNRLADNLSASEFVYQGWPIPFDLHFDESSKTFVRVIPDLTLRAFATRYLYFAKQEIGRLLYLAGPRLLVLPLILVGGIGFLLSLIRRRKDAFWQAILLSPLLILPFLHIEDRYLLPAFPVICLWIVSGAWTSGKWLSRQLERSQSRIAIKPVWVSGVVIALLLGVYTYRMATMLPKTHTRQLTQQAAAWMQAARLPEGKTMAQEPALAFYKNSVQVWLPYGPFDHVLRYARENEVRYVFVSSNDTANPIKDRLLAGNDLPSDLHLLQSFATKDETARLFELAPEADAPDVARR